MRPLASRLAPRLAVLLPLALFPAAARAAPVAGFVEEWPGTSLQGWTGQANYVNPGTGGVGGAGDGFLIVSRPFPEKLGAVSFGSEYQGDWVAAGIRSVRVWLNDVGDDEPLEIHFSLGNGFGFWQYDEPFFPPENSWAEFVVDLTSEARFTRLFGSGTLEAALRAVDRVHLRHDTGPPFVQVPPDIQGDFGIDRLMLSDVNVPVLAATWGRLKALYR